MKCRLDQLSLVRNILNIHKVKPRKVVSGSFLELYIYIYIYVYIRHRPPCQCTHDGIYML